MHVGDRQGGPFLAGTAAPYLAAFRKGLVKSDFVEGHKVAIDAHYAQQPSDWQS
jgi:hypothetical protein